MVYENAEPAPLKVSDGGDGSDFAEAALRLVTGKVGETEAKIVVQESAVTEPRKTSIPDALLKKPESKVVDADKAKDIAADLKEEESEISKIAKPEFKDPKRAAQWDELHGKAADFEKKSREGERRIADLEKRIADAEAKGKDTEALQSRLADAEKNADEHLKLVRQVNVELDPEFRAKYVEGRSSKVKEVEQIVADAGGEPSDVAAALALKGKARVDAMRLISDDMPGYLQGLLGTAIRELDTLDRDADAKRSDAGKYLADRQRESDRLAQLELQDRVKNEEIGWQKAERKIAAEFVALNRLDGNEEWNATRDKTIEAARQDYESAHAPEKKAEFILGYHVAKTYQARLTEEMEYSGKMEKENTSLKAELKKLYGGAPSLTGRASSNGETATKDMDFASRAMHEMPTGR